MERWMNLLSCFLVAGLMACGGGDGDDKSPTEPETKTPEDARRELGELGIQYDKESFVKAVENADTLAIELFIDAGMDPNTKNDDGDPVLIWAVSESMFDIAEILINKGADINATNSDGRTALLEAIAEDNMTLVQWLLDNGANVNWKKESGLTPLLEASCLQSKDIVELLLENGADINITTETRDEYLTFSASIGDIETVRMLIEAGADPNIPLYGAVYGNHIDIVQLLLDAGADPNQPESLFSLALSKDYRETARLLLDHGATVDPYNSVVATFMESLIEEDNVEYLQLLLDAGADPNWFLLFAVQHEKTDIVQLLLNEGADPNAKSKNGLTILIIASVFIEREEKWGSNAEIVKLLLNAGADPNLGVEYYSGYIGEAYWEMAASPIILAVLGACEGYIGIEIIQLLIEAGVDITDKNLGTMLLDWAVDYGKTEIEKLLRDAGATRWND